ncbi:meiotic recombination protein REC114 [Kogia breviceps]|uniref:meiotic recombination protein REC114 n=1 Tax=Kogia breviceps TaxID=27615 RepID=UPI0034D20F96
MLGRLRAAGTLPVRLRVPGLAALHLLPGRAGRGDTALSRSLPPSRGQGRGARPSSRRPAPAGNNGRGLKRRCGRGARKTAPERRAHDQHSSGARVPRAGGLSVCPAARALWPATRELASLPLAEPGRPVPGLPLQPSGAQRPAGLTSAAASPGAPSGSARLPRPGIFMKPPQLAGWERIPSLGFRQGCGAGFPDLSCSELGARLSPAVMLFSWVSDPPPWRRGQIPRWSFPCGASQRPGQEGVGELREAQGARVRPKPFEVFDSSEESGHLVLTIVISGHFFISQGQTLLEGFSLIGSKNWLKIVRRMDCLLFGTTIKNKSRMFRVQFSGGSKEQALEHCCSCVQNLAQYITVQVPDGISQELGLSPSPLCTGESQRKGCVQSIPPQHDSHQNPEQQQWVPAGTSTPRGRISVAWLAQSLLASEELPVVYEQSAWNTEELGPFLRLCLMDQNFPAFVEEVEKELKKLTELSN